MSFPRTGPSSVAPAWSLIPADEAAVEKLADELSLSPVVARILVARGLADPAAAWRFLNPAAGHLHDPFLMYQMEDAVTRLAAALRHGEKILIYGDYDADGVCAVAILMEGLAALGGRVDYYIPHRIDEGYGLHPQVLRQAHADGVSLVVTVDTGVAAVEAADYARDLGLDLIITDHHQPGPDLPQAIALLHPQHPQGSYPFPSLCGAGVAFKLLQALGLVWEQPDLAMNWVDLAAIATVADVVPLLDENRVLVALGLQRIRQNPRPGIAALCAAAGVDPATLDADQVAFQLAPRLNAAGRMGDAGVALQVLMAPSALQAQERVTLLEAQNLSRQQVQQQILEEARSRLDLDRQPVVVLSDPWWHPGVVGIVAARLAGESGRPVLLAQERDGIAHGSARSVPGFSIAGALAQCAHLLHAFGGHDQAAGFQVPVENLAQLGQRLGELFEQHRLQSPPPSINYEARIQYSRITLDLVRELERLAPFGEGNPEPRLLVEAAPVQYAGAIGKDGSHLRLQLPAGIQGIGFGLGSLAATLRVPGRADLLACPRETWWRGRRRLELRVESLRPVAAPSAAAAQSPASSRAQSPQREALAAIYRRLRQFIGWEQASMDSVVQGLAARTGFSPRGVMQALLIFQELDLVQMRDGGITLLEPQGKVDLYASPTFRLLIEQNGRLN